LRAASGFFPASKGVLLRPTTISHCASLALLLISVSALSQSASQPAPAAAPASPPLTRAQATAIIADSRKIVSPNGVEELLPVQINGITQWISVRGKDRRNPVLLFLHGGPGSPTMPADYTFQTPWEDYFTVVQWDQRGSGKTYAANDPALAASNLTITQMNSDAEQVVRYLLDRYHKKKIFLLGHSWGSILGVQLAERHPEWFYAYIGVGQVVNALKGEKMDYDWVLASARADHNADAIRELEALAPYPGEATIERITTERKWSVYYGGLTWGRKSFAYEANAWTLSPDYTDHDVDSVDAGSLLSVAHLLGDMASIDFDSTTRFKCPIFLFEGRHDYTVSSQLAATWFARIQAPEKKLVWFENAAHMPMQEEPGRFLYRLITDVRPIAVRAGDVSPETN
jgi:pimeloyl-ACP methyl ester carboxylesterase